MTGELVKSTLILAVALAAYGLMWRRSASERHVVLLTGVLGSVLPFAWLALRAKLPGAVWSIPVTVPHQARQYVPLPLHSLSVTVHGGYWSWADWALLAWALGALILLVRMASGYLAAWRVARRSRALNWRTPVAVYASRELQSPVLTGLLRPVILLPADAGQWPGAMRAAVLEHECAHLSRLDHWWHLAVELVRCLYWINPLVWVGARLVAVERERACDDLVLARGIDAHDYALHLLEFARQQRRLPAAAMAEVSNLEGRLMAILNPEMRRNVAGRGALVASLALVALTLPMTMGMTQNSRTVAAVVVDASGAAVPDAVVLLKPSAGGVIERTSGEDGTATFPGIASGLYTLEVHARGFRAAGNSLEVLPGDGPIVRKVAMELGHVQETMGVQADRPAGVAARHDAVQGPSSKGGQTEMPKLVKMVRPAYPAEAKAAGVEGSVVLQVVISAEGMPTALKVISSPADSLSQAAMDAVKGWQYMPAKLNGAPTECVSDVTLNFELK
jgi:TonB family protein